MRTSPGGAALINPPRFKPQRDRRVSILSVACPACKVDVGEKCTFPGGRGSHPIRRRMAVRLDNEMRGL